MQQLQAAPSAQQQAGTPAPSQEPAVAKDQESQVLNRYKERLAQGQGMTTGLSDAPKQFSADLEIPANAPGQGKDGKSYTVNPNLAVTIPVLPRSEAGQSRPLITKDGTSYAVAQPNLGGYDPAWSPPRSGQKPVAAAKEPSFPGQIFGSVTSPGNLPPIPVEHGRMANQPAAAVPPQGMMPGAYGMGMGGGGMGGMGGRAYGEFRALGSAPRDGTKTADQQATGAGPNLPPSAANPPVQPGVATVVPAGLASIDFDVPRPKNAVVYYFTTPGSDAEVTARAASGKLLVGLARLAAVLLAAAVILAIARLVRRTGFEWVARPAGSTLLIVAGIVLVFLCPLGLGLFILGLTAMIAGVVLKTRRRFAKA